MLSAWETPITFHNHPPYREVINVSGTVKRPLLCLLTSVTRVDVLVMAGTNEVRAAKNVTRTIPIIFANVADPVADGLVDSLARPGGNITGFTTITAVLAGKRLELLKETVPKLSRVAVLWDPRNVASTQQWKESQLSARELGLQLHSMEVSRADQYERAFHEAMKDLWDGSCDQTSFALLRTAGRLARVEMRSSDMPMIPQPPYGPLQPSAMRPLMASVKSGRLCQALPQLGRAPRGRTLSG